MALKVKFTTATEGFDAAIREKYKPMAEAGTEAIREISDEVKTAGRADIAAAGFGKRWQNAFRVDVYPKRGVSLNAAALVYHKIPYADIFETGGVIKGKPKLWIPLSSTPKKIGTQRMSAKLFQQKIGKLQYVKRPGGKPLLMAKASVSSGQAKSGKYGKVTLSKLRSGAAGNGIIRAVPLFVAVDSVKLRDRFSLREIIGRTADKLATVYTQKLAQKDID